MLGFVTALLAYFAAEKEYDLVTSTLAMFDEVATDEMKAVLKANVAKQEDVTRAAWRTMLDASSAAGHDDATYDHYVCLAF